MLDQIKCEGEGEGEGQEEPVKISSTNGHL